MTHRLCRGIIPAEFYTIIIDNDTDSFKVLSCQHLVSGSSVKNCFLKKSLYHNVGFSTVTLQHPRPSFIATRERAKTLLWRKKNIADRTFENVVFLQL